MDVANFPKIKGIIAIQLFDLAICITKLIDNRNY